MARHALVEAPQTEIFTIPPDIREGYARDLGGQLLVGATHRADLLADNAAYFLQTGAPHLAHETAKQAAAEYTAVQRTVDEVREQVAEAPDSQLAEDYLRPYIGRLYGAAKHQGANHATMLRWLGDKEYGASDSQLLDFTLQHIRRLTQRRQNSEDLETIAWARSDYMAKVEQQVDAGMYDKDALRTLDKVRKAEIVIGDVWDTKIVNLNGYYLFGQDFVVVGQRVYDNDAARQDVYGTTLHELDHLQFPNTMAEPEWFREAFAEHDIQSMVYGEWDTFDPAARPNDEGIYASERRLLHILMKEGRYVIPAQVGTRSHTSRPTGKARSTFERAIAESWAPDMLEWTDARVKQLTDIYQDQGLLHHSAVSAAAGQTGNELLVLVQGMRRK